MQLGTVRLRRSTAFHLQLAGWRRHMPLSALLVPAGLKPEVEAVLDRYLTEWPQP